MLTYNKLQSKGLCFGFFFFNMGLRDEGRVEESL